MVIRQAKRFDELIYERNKARDLYLQDKENIMNNYDSIYNRMTKIIKNVYYYYFLVLVAFAITMLIILKYAASSKSVVAIILLSVSGVLLILTFVPVIIRMRFKLKWQKQTKNKEDYGKKATRLNDECAKIAVAVICFSEHYNELKLIKNEVALKERWRELNKLYIEAIDCENGYNATCEDFINYYNIWLKKITEVKKN